MTDSLYELLTPHVADEAHIPSTEDQTTTTYLTRLSTLTASSLTTTEPESLKHEAQSVTRSLQALTKRSHKSIDTSLTSLSNLKTALPDLATNTTALRSSLPDVAASANTFSQKYSKLATENAVLDRRKRAMRLGENADRIADILDMPTLLSSTIAASTNATTAAGGAAGSMTSANAHYTSALDLYAHIKRLQRLYPDSPLIKGVAVQAEEAMRNMTTNLISTLRSQSLKLASAMRLVGLLRRVAPDLDDRLANAQRNWSSTPSEGSLGALFLVCRLGNLMTTLEALEPLKELADQETTQRINGSSGSTKATGNYREAYGQQTERYLKRYVEIFREQCFAIVSMYKSIFPSSLQGPFGNLDGTGDNSKGQQDQPEDYFGGGLAKFGKSAHLKKRGTQQANSPSGNPLSPNPLSPTGGEASMPANMPDDPTQKLPSALATFTAHIVDMLMDTLRAYLPNLKDQSSRDSLLTQVLYCAGSLGRLGGDFGMMLSMLEDDLEETEEGVEEAEIEISSEKQLQNSEWVEVMKKHRVQANRLELLASGVGTSSKKADVATAEVALTS